MPRDLARQLAACGPLPPSGTTALPAHHPAVAAAAAEPPPARAAPVQVEERPAAFDIKLEDGQAIYSSSGGGLPEFAVLFDRLRQAGLQATA